MPPKADPDQETTAPCESPDPPAERASPAPPIMNPPETANTGRPKGQYGESASAMRASPAESDGPAGALGDSQMEAAIKHLESVLLQRLPGLVETSAKEQIDKVVESRVDTIVDRRVSPETIDAMVVASVAKSDLVKKADAPTAAPPSAGYAAGGEQLVKQQADMEQRIMDRLQVEMQNQMKGQMTEMLMPVPTSRPPTGPRPISSERQQRVTPQTKAAWTSDQLYTVANVPNVDTSWDLTHSDLERNLTEKVLSMQPDRASLGFSEIIMRDIANSVVRELVGIFESLLDRLLIEKKHDTIRTMVAELLTEDMQQVMATSRDQLKQKELGHITRELERLGLEAKEREQSWQDRFLITQELRDSQDDLYATLDERCRGIEGRLVSLEQNSVQRSELDQRFQHKVDEVKELRQQVDGHRGRVEDVSSQLAQQQRECAENFLTRGELVDYQKQVVTDISGCHEKISSGLKELREDSVTKAVLNSTKTELDERLSSLDKQMTQATQSISSAETALQKAESYSQDSYCTKVVSDERFSKLQSEAIETNAKVQKCLSDLEDGKATKKELEEVSTSVGTSLTDLNQSVGKHTTDVDRISGSLVSLEERLDQTYATRVYVDNKSKTLVEEVVQRSDTREELGKLWKELEAERERLRQTDRLQRDTRNDLNGALDDIQGLRNRSVELAKRSDTLDTAVNQVDARENTHWESGQESLRSQKQDHDDLGVFYKALRDEFMANKEYHSIEAERLKKHSTMCYMEQIDKALNLTESVARCEKQLKLPALGSP